ncbi:uncharacterized protein LOC131325750 isoform X2 [Rhododendron vialii]|uniref:uncharacterized protein LOC131325750 isoform X2 n=1 Tax=Rhododendron vialii TaxID=182163 RepID=UPI00265E9345|nr:uncharacterized protein LOC131325750 isoform X2 [Rhododendron vialii]
MENRHCCKNDDNGLKIEDVGGQVPTTLESATTNLYGSRRATGETPSETLLISSPSCGKGKHKEKQMQTLARRTLERVGTRENIETAKSGKHSRLDTRELFKCKKQGLKPVSKSFGKNRLDAHSYKQLLRSRALRGKVTELLLQRRDKMSGEGGEFIVTNGSPEVDKGVAETRPSNLKMQRLTVKPGRDFSTVTLSKDGMGFEAGLSLECREEKNGDVQSTESQPEIDRCIICMLGGKLLCCDGRECKKSFHLSCLDPPFTHAPPGVWHCSWCVQKKLQSGVHAVSEGVESVVEDREVESDHEMQRQKEFLVKYKGLAHVHNRWIPEEKIKVENPELLAKYSLAKYKRYQRWKTEWTLPDRLLQKRWLCLPKQCNKDWEDLTSSFTTEWLVKWTGLGYDHATWELENSSFMKSPEAVKLIGEFEGRHKGEKRISCPFEGDKGGEVTLSGGSPGVQHEPSSNINKLREFWLRGRNALVYDDQERIVNVILFILSLQDNTLPFLIITTSSSLSTWEAEFSQHKSDINFVVYKGNKDVRASIRSLEFYNEDGCLMFQVLLSPIDAVLEDSRILDGIKWGALIVDEYQRSCMSSHHERIKELNAHMKLLLVNNRIKNMRYEYLHLLSILDSGRDGVEEKASENDSKNDICKLKAKLASFVAFESKPRTSRFVEYWVPVQLSNVQLEQYCATLLSSATLLCSHLRNDLVDSLRKILIMTRKCCDHPYLVDTERSLRASIIRDFPVSEHLGAEIEMSGKLQLLDKFLFKIKERGLRVLILFQSIGGSGVISTGDILDDFVHERFGKDSYAHIDSGKIAHSKKQATLDCFNNKESNKFVFLIESRACLHSIKLSSIDLVVLFNSDWDPLNDLRALEKITIESQFEELKVFRLYSSHTVEEKVLILAKEGLPLDSKIENIIRSTCHMLLTWGALHLFNKLDDFHGGHSSLVSHLNLTFEEFLTTDVVTEFSALLPNDGEKRNPNNSIILEVNRTEGAYPRNISLPGELDLETQSVDNISTIQRLLHNEPTHVFWENLLDGRNPRWKFLSGSSPKISRRTQDLVGSPEEPTCMEDGGGRKRRTVVHNTFELMCSSSSPKIGQRTQNLVGSPEEPTCMEDGVGRKRRTVVHNTFELMCSKPRTKRNRKLHSWGKDINLATQCVSRGSNGTNALTLDQEARQRYREVNSIIGEAPTLEFRKQPQLHVSTDVPSDECGITITNVTASILVQNHRSRQCHPSARQAQAPIPPARVDSTGLPNSFLWQPFTVGSLQPSIGAIETGESIQSMATVPNGNNSLQASHVPQPDLLQMEIERIQKAEEQALKIHEDTKLQLKVECEKEIDEIRKKYDRLLQHDVMVLLQKKKDFETHYNKIYVNKLLAETYALTYEGDKAGLLGTEQANVPEFMDAISEFYLQQSAVRNSTTTLEKSSSPLIHRRGSYGGGCELRAPAPHLQHLRPPSTEVGLPHRLPSHAPTKLPIHRAPSNLSVPSCGLAQVTEPVKSQWRSSGINQPDIITGLPVIDGFLPMGTELLRQFITPLKFTSA